MLDQQFPLTTNISKTYLGDLNWVSRYLFSKWKHNTHLLSKIYHLSSSLFHKRTFSTNKVEKNLRIMYTSLNHLSLIKNKLIVIFLILLIFDQFFLITFKIDLPVTTVPLSTCVKDWGRLRSLLLKDLGLRGDAGGRGISDDWTLPSLIARRRS